MILTFTVLFAVGIGAGLFMSAFMGANDVSNAMGVTLGCKALKLRYIIILAVIFELLGALLLGSFVSERVASGIIDPPPADATDLQVREYMLAMCCVLLGSGVWLFLATMLSVPVSTTHSVIGSIVALGIFMNGLGSVKWWSLLTMAIGWIASPFVGMIASFIVWFLLKTLIIESKPEHRQKRVFLSLPFLVAITAFILSMFLLAVGTKAVHVNVPIYISLPSALVIAIISGLLSQFFAMPIIKTSVKKALEFDADSEERVAILDGEKEPTFSSSVNAEEVDPVFENTKGEAVSENHSTVDNIDDEGPLITSLDKSYKNLSDGDDMNDVVESPQEEPLTEEERTHAITERKSFNFLVIITSCCIATAHGSNDISNAAGPLATVANIFMHKGIPESASVPFWVTLIAGVGLVVGLGALGYRVMRTLGEKITKLTASRAFVSQLTTSTITLISSALGLPLSTTHVTVGCVYGVSLVDIFPDIRKLQWRLVLNIVLSWVITIPAAAFFSVGSFFLLQQLFRLG